MLSWKRVAVRSVEAASNLHGLTHGCLYIRHRPCCVDCAVPVVVPRCCSAMTKTLDSTAVYAYTTLISMIVCLPFALIAEGPALQAGAAAAIAKVGAASVVSSAAANTHRQSTQHLYCVGLCTPDVACKVAGVDGVCHWICCAPSSPVYAFGQAEGAPVASWPASHLAAAWPLLPPCLFASHRLARRASTLTCSWSVCCTTCTTRWVHTTACHVL